MNDDLIFRKAAIDEISEYGSGNSVHMSVGELKGIRKDWCPLVEAERREYG